MDATMLAPREEGQYRCTNCGGTTGWFGMLVRNGVRENCASCLPRRALVGTMERIESQNLKVNG